MSPLVDAATLAEHLGLSRDTVYRRADELGVIRIGGRLRFDLERAVTPAPPPPPWKGRAVSAPPSARPPSPAGRPRQAQRGAPLLPIHEQRKAA